MERDKTLWISLLSPWLKMGLLRYINLSLLLIGRKMVVVNLIIFHYRYNIIYILIAKRRTDSIAAVFGLELH